MSTELTRTAGDVINSFWVPSLAGKRYLVTGRETVMKITPDPDVEGKMIPCQ